MTPTPEPMSITDRLIAELRAEADGSLARNDGPKSTRADRNVLMRTAAARIQVQRDRIQEQRERIERLLVNQPAGAVAVAKPHELTREDAIGMVLHSGATVTGEDAVTLARRVFEFTHETDEVPPRGDWELPEGELADTRDDYLERVVFQALGAASTAWSQAPRGVFDDRHATSIGTALLQAVKAYADGEGPWVEIGGQKMTQAQYDAARFPLLNTASEAVPPAHGLAVGDVLSPDQIKHAPVGLEMTDRDDDLYVSREDGWWRMTTLGKPDRPNGTSYEAEAPPRHYAPYTVTKLPGDRTPRLGDRVRVIDSAVGADPNRNHEKCFGQVGTLRRSEGWPGAFALNQRDGLVSFGSHVGPLSDFELVERAK